MIYHKISPYQIETIKASPTDILKNYQYLQETWKQEQLSSFKDFLRWYNEINVVQLLEAMQNLIAFHHGKDMNILKLSCNLPNMANICLYKSTDANFYLIREIDKDLKETSLRRCWLRSINRIDTRSLWWWNFYSEINNFMQTFKSDWC